MAAYRRVYDSRHLQADCQEPGSAPEPYARATSMGYLYLLQFYLSQTEHCTKNINHEITSFIGGIKQKRPWKNDFSQKPL